MMYIDRKNNSQQKLQKICFNEEQPLNAYLPIDLTDDGIPIISNFIHWQKAKSLTIFTDDGIEI